MAKTRKRLLTSLIGVALLIPIGFDLAMTHSQRSFVTVTPLAASQAEPALVALATSGDLSPAVPLDSPDLTYEQVRQVVWLALDRDTSPGALRKIVAVDDWVGIKVNLVTAPLIIGERKIGGFWNGAVDNIPHWGSTSDLRVTKALIAYLIDRVGPRRISIMDGSGEIARTGSPYFDSYGIDGWTVTWEAFDNLSYQGMVDDFNAAQSTSVVDIVDLNDDDLVLKQAPGGGLQLLGGRKRGWAYEDFQPGFGTPRGQWWVPQTLLAVDKLIDQATLKTTAPGITVFLKNYVGTVGIRGFDAGPAKMAVIDNVAIMSGYMDMVSIRPPDYNLAAGFWASDGWYGGTKDINHNVVIAGHNVVAAEAVAARIMGFNPRDLQQLLLARDIGLGSFEESDYVVVNGDPEALKLKFPGNPNWRPSGFQEFLMIGPFDGDDMAVDHLGDEADVRPLLGTEMGGQAWWTYQHRPGYPEPYTDSSHLELGSLDNQTLYAFTYVISPHDQEAHLLFGSDGPARVWVNGQVVYEKASGSNYHVQGSTIPLHQGANALLVKTVGTLRGAGIGVSLTDGDRMLSDIRPALTSTISTAVTEPERGAAMPADAVLEPGYPNPFNASVTIPYTLSADGPVHVTVWDALGQRVRVLVDETGVAGAHHVVWDGRDDSGQGVASGTYLVRLATDRVVRTQKVSLLK